MTTPTPKTSKTINYRPAKAIDSEQINLVEIYDEVDKYIWVRKYFDEHAGSNQKINKDMYNQSSRLFVIKRSNEEIGYVRFVKAYRHDIGIYSEEKYSIAEVYVSIEHRCENITHVMLALVITMQPVVIDSEITGTNTHALEIE